MKKSMAEATEALNVCAAIFTFILCFSNTMCFFFSLLPKKNPSTSWISFNWSMYSHLIGSTPIYEILFCSHQADSALAWSCDMHQIWHRSWMKTSGCGNHVWISETFILKPSCKAVCWLVNVPSESTAKTLIHCEYNKQSVMRHA